VAGKQFAIGKQAATSWLQFTSHRLYSVLLKYTALHFALMSGVSPSMWRCIIGLLSVSSLLPK